MKQKNRWNHFWQKHRKMLSVAGISLSLMSAAPAFGQVSSYAFSESSGTYTPITAGVVIGTATSALPTSTPESVPMDDFTYGAQLPFSFNFNGELYDSVRINTNGWISFGTSTASTPSPISSTTTYKGVICAFGHDMMGIFATTGITTTGSNQITAVANTSRCKVGALIQGAGIPAASTITAFTANTITISANATATVTAAVYLSFTTGEIRMETIGTAPNRTAVIQFSGMSKYSNGAGDANNHSLDFQIRLSETTGSVAVVYNNFLGASTSYTSEVGLRGYVNSDYNNRTSTTSWSATSPGTSNSATMTWTNTIKPANGQTYTWVPPSCFVPNTVTMAAITPFTATVSWTAPVPAPANGYEYYISTSNTAPTATTTPTASVSAGVTTAPLSGLPANTQHYVWVRSVCSPANKSVWSNVVSFTTLCTVPTPGATQSSAGSTICLGQSTTLTVTNPETGTGISYLWQSSQDGVSYQNITGATAISYLGTIAARYYRIRVICTSGPDTSYSTPIQFSTVNNIATTSPGQRCGIGTVNLGATANAGATVKWYANLTGGAPLGSGNSFASPFITATTVFYAEASTSVSSAKVGYGTTSMGATSYPNPLSANYGGTKTQMLFLASELQNQGLLAGNITSIAFDVTNINASGILNDFTIRLGTSSVSSLTGLVPVANTVYNASFTPSTTGLVTFTFTTPYNWDGVSNLVLETVHNSGNAGNGSGTQVAYTTTPGNTVYTRAIQNITPATVAGFEAGILTNTTGVNSASANRPNITFGGAALCKSFRTPVTATVNTAPAFTITDDKTACNGAVTQLTVTSPATNYDHVVWSPVSNLYTDAAATVPYTLNTNSSTVYHKSATAGLVAYSALANNTTSSCGALDTIKMQTLPATASAAATPGTICQSGASTINITPGIQQTGMSYQWQSSTNNTTFTDIANATAVSYATPTITATQYYRSTIKNSSGVACFNSASDTVFVSIPTVLQTTPGERCGPGAVTLAAATNAGYNLNWYAAAAGGAVLGTGSNFTTPVISTNTTYYVAANTGSAGTGTIGAGVYTSTTGSPAYSGVSPYAYHYGNYKHQMLITAAELIAQGAAAGSITSLAFDVVTVGTPVASFNNFNIKLIPTSSPALTSAFISGGNDVYSATSVTPVVGLNTYTFATPFNWDGTSNIVVQTCYNNNNSGAVASSAQVRYDSTSFISHTIFRVDGTNNNVCAVANGSTNNDGPVITGRPKMILGFNSLCESTRTPVVATVKAPPSVTLTPNGTVNLCNGQSQTLTASGGGTYAWLQNNTVMTGQTSNTLPVSLANTYRVVVTGTNGCSDTSVAANVAIALPPVVNLGNDTAICSGNSISLNAGNAGATYLWSNAATTQNITAATAGSYYVAVTGANTCVGRDTLVLTLNPAPAVNLGSDTGICTGNSLTLNAGTGTAYLWDDASTAATRTVNAAGQFYVAVTGANSCIGHDTIAITIHTLPIVNLGNDTAICEGSILILNAGNAGAVYNWDNASANQTRDVNAAGSYSVTVTDVNGCSNADTVVVSAIPPPSGTINVADNGNGSYTYTVDNAQQVTSSGWNFGDGQTASGSPANHTYATNGNYTVSLILVNECGDSVTVTRSLNVTGVVGIDKLALDQTQLSLYPNPARTVLNIVNKSSLSMHQVTAYNLLGQLVYRSAATNPDRHEINISSLASGVYTLKIEIGKGTIVRKFEVLK